MKTDMLKRSGFLKTISLLLVLSFSFYNVSFAVTEEPKDVPKASKIGSELTVEDIGVAIDAGIVKSKHQGKSGKIVVHIQDAHCNYEAQNNINKILDQLAKENNVRMISVEGAEGIVDTAWFKAFPDEEIRREVADYFMKKGEITGAEFFSINSDYDGTIFGAENREYYVRNLKAFTEVYPYKDIIEKYFLNLRTVVNRVKLSVYPPKLKELDLKIRAFDNKEMELSDFVEYLYMTAKKYRVPVDKYENFKKLVDTLEYEKKIDFDIVDKERNDYIDALSKKLSKEKMTELVGESIKFKKGRIKAVDFYSYLRQLADEFDIPIVREYPNLFYYYLYTKLYETIDNEGLFKEINIVQDELKEKLFTDNVQRELDRYSRAIDLYIDLINIELTNDDYDLFKELINEFSLTDVVVFLDKLSTRYGLGYTLGDVPVQISENLPRMVDFYEVAMERDKVLVANTLNQMKEEKKDICVMIAGGFHTKGIKHILEKQDISYVVVTPKITKDVETPYIQVLTNQRTSLEDIITESAAMPGMGAIREKVAEPKGGTLSPLLRTALSTMLLRDPKKLEELSMMIGKVKDGQSVQELAKEFTEGAVGMFVRDWLSRVEARIKEKPEGAEEWREFIAQDEKWSLLLGVYIDLMHRASIKANVPDGVLFALLEIVARGFREERKALTTVPERAPREAARPDRYRELFGLVSLEDFGQELPLARELVSPVPGGFLLNVSNVDKNIVVTAVEKVEGKNPTVILGLSPTAVKEYKGEVMMRYQMALTAYGEALNMLYVSLKEAIGEKALAGYTDVKEAAEKFLETKLPGEVPGIRSDLVRLSDALKKLNRFHNFVEVTKPGQIISISAGTLYSIPRSVAAVEIYRPGEGVRAVDLAPVNPAVNPIVRVTPVGVRFPQKVREAVGMIKAEAVVPEELPSAEISTVGPVEIEALPKSLEKKETGVRVITFSERSELEIPAARVAKARNYIVLSGKAAIEIEGQTLEVPLSPEGTRALTIPANLEKSFKIRGEKGTMIVETSVPSREETLEVPLDTEAVTGTKGHRVERNVVFTFSEVPLIHDTYERTTIVKGAYPFMWPEDHAVSIMVQRGSVDIIIEGEKPVQLEAGEVFVPSQYSPRFEVVSRGADAAVVKIDYKNTIEEDILFANFDAIRKHVQQIAALGEINVVIPGEIFADKGLGSRDWWERMFHTYVSPDIHIVPYWSAPREGVETTGLDAAMAELEGKSRDVANILIATSSKIRKASSENREFLKDFRVIGIPDIDLLEIEGEKNPLKEEDGIHNKGWFFTREAIGAALLLSIVTPKDVFFEGEDPKTVAYDMKRFMSVVLGRDVSKGDICYMLPYNEVERAIPEAAAAFEKEGWFNELKENLKDLETWFTSLLKKALLAMPIRPFDTNEDILRRHKNLFEAVKAV